MVKKDDAKYDILIKNNDVLIKNKRKYFDKNVLILNRQRFDIEKGMFDKKKKLKTIYILVTQYGILIKERRCYDKK